MKNIDTHTIQQLETIITKLIEVDSINIAEFDFLIKLKNILKEHINNFINITDAKSNLFGIFIDKGLECPEYIAPLESTANRLLKEFIEDGYNNSYIKELEIYKIIKDGIKYLYGPIVLDSITQPSGNDQIEQEKIIQARNEKEKTDKILEKVSQYITDEDLHFLKQKLENI